VLTGSEAREPDAHRDPTATAAIAGVKKGLDIQLDMVAETLGTEARRPS